jgi:hypothetical protein
METPMSEDNYDDGLVHSHSWSSAPAPKRHDAHPVAHVEGARTPSTVSNDECMYCD